MWKYLFSVIEAKILCIYEAVCQKRVCASLFRTVFQTCKRREVERERDVTKSLSEEHTHQHHEGPERQGRHPTERPGTALWVQVH